MYNTLYVFVALILLQVQSKIVFRNINCTSVDKDFTNFEYCFMKAVNRTYKYISLKAVFYHVPITNISVGINLMKRANGYKPFLYNFTFDGCKFMRHRTNPLISFFYGFLAAHSNINHSCPYDHDIILEKLSTQYVSTYWEKLPLPQGDYAVFTQWYAYNIMRSCFDVHFSQLG